MRKDILKRTGFLGMGLAVGMAFSAVGAVESELSKKALTVLPVTKPPVIDGKLDDAAWKKAVKFTKFRQYGTTNAAKVPTTAYLTFDENCIYVAFDSALAKGEKPNRRITGRDNYFFDYDDCVEFFVDPTGSGGSYYHFAVNCNGAFFDLFHFFDKGEEAEWNAPGTRSATDVKKGRWTAELAVPFADLDAKPDASVLWRVNFARERRTDKGAELSSVSGYFCKGDAFSFVRFGAPVKKMPFEVVSLGAMAKMHNPLLLNRNIFTVKVKAGQGPFTATVQRVLDSKTTPVGEVVSTRNKQDTLLKIPYEIAGKSGEQFIFQVKDNKGKVLFDKTEPARIRKPRYAVPSNPLYKELLTNKDPGLHAEGQPAWVEGMFEGTLAYFAKRYGVEVSAEPFVQEYVKNGIIPVNSQVLLESYRMPEFWKRFGLKAVVWPSQPTPRSGLVEAHLFYEPCFSQYTNSAWHIASKPHVYAVFWGDEMGARVFKNMIRNMGDRGSSRKDFFERQKYIKTVVNDRVKKTTGYGKFGLPQGVKDSDPFRWIAWYRYANQKMRNIWSGLRADILKKYPHMRFIWQDPMGGITPWELNADADKGTCDIYTYQAVGPTRVGLITKFVADLTRKDVYPLLHLDHGSGYSWSPDEVREIVSMVFRAGGTGFISYSNDYSPSDINTQNIEFGAPERWNAILELYSRIRKLPPLRFPSPDLGYFYCNTSWQSINPCIFSWDDGEMVSEFNILGPKVMKSWFRYIDENVILNHFDELAGLKAIVLSFGKYQLPGIIEKLKKYAEKGGTLICFDPESFTWAADGTSLTKARQKLFGVEVGEVFSWNEKVTFQTDALGVSKGTVLPSIGPARTLKVAKKVKVLATFANDQPAIVETAVGKGRTIFFAFNPLVSEGLKSEKWSKVFRETAKSLGVKLDQDIWRFTFLPFERDLYPKDPEGVCLTENYQRLEADIPVIVKNAETKGTYRFLPAPDGSADEGGTGEISFSKGDLTDRHYAYRKNVKPGLSSGYVLEWKTNVPVEVVFDFKKSYPIQSVRLFYAKRLPRFTVQVSRDGKQWKEAGQNKTEQWTIGVRMIEVKFKPQNARYVKLSFAKRDKVVLYDKKKKEKIQPTNFILIEAEVWAEKK